MSNTVWSLQNETKIKEISEVSTAYKEEHSHLSKYYNYIHKRITCFGMLLAPITGIFASTDTSAYLEEQTKDGILSGLSLISGILMLSIRIGKFEELKTENEHAAVLYESLEHDTTSQLALERGERISAKDFIDATHDKLTHMPSKLPKVSEKLTKMHTVCTNGKCKLMEV
jgi:hypothetical protein